jgi:hypothetical protein
VEAKLRSLYLLSLGKNPLTRVLKVDKPVLPVYSVTEGGKEFAWSRGLGIELSPIKTRSARKSPVLNLKVDSAPILPTDGKALRALKALARTKVMLVLSLNLRGTGGVLKLASVRSVLDRTRPNIVFLQETLVNADKARCFFQLLRPKWLVCAVNSAGTSGGLLASWDPSFFNLVPYLTYGGILLTGYCLGF